MKNPLRQFEGCKTDFLMFSKDICGYCVAAKNLLNARGLTYTEINLERDHQLRADLVNLTGHRTVPIIFDVRNKTAFVGGYDELTTYL